MKIFVAGGAGLIGSSLCESLLEDGNEIICADNFKTGSLQNIQSILNHKNFQLKEYDITKKIPVFKLDQIYNLASPTDPNKCFQNPIDTIRSNIEGTINILELARYQKVPVVHISSIRTLEPRETFNKNAPYIESKRCSETICYEYKKKGVDVKVARLFNVYGERMTLDDSRVLPTFVRNAIQNKDLDIYGSGKQQDSFCYVMDIVAGLKELMKVKVDNPVNMGSNEFVSIKHLAKLVISLTGSKSQINIISPDSVFYDRSTILVNNLVNWEPSISLTKGIQLLSKSFKKQLNP